MSEKTHKVYIDHSRTMGVTVKYPIHKFVIADSSKQIANMQAYFQTLETTLVARVQHPVYIQQATPPDTPGLWIKLDEFGVPCDIGVNTTGITI